jgi:mono/diheme cytochrome c family protein
MERKVILASIVRRGIFALFVIGPTAGMLASSANAQGAREFSKDEFNQSCASCHGLSGRGDGPVAKSLAKAPADLTKLSQKNGGVFPVSRLYDIIDGRSQVLAHGPREMPVWGDIYAREMQKRWPTDVLSKELIQLKARVRILMLIEYISTMQEK